MRFWHWAEFLLTCAPFFKSPRLHVVLVLGFWLCRCTKTNRCTCSCAAVIMDGHLAHLLFSMLLPGCPEHHVKRRTLSGGTAQMEGAVMLLSSVALATPLALKIKILLVHWAPINVLFLSQDFTEDLSVSFWWDTHDACIKLFFSSFFLQIALVDSVTFAAAAAGAALRMTM